MAHQVEKMAYAGQTPWHGLGTPMVEGMPFDTWFAASGLNWSVNEAPVEFLAGDARYRYKGMKVLYRSDTTRPLSVVSDRYRVVQPKAVLEFYRDLCDSYGFVLETAGVLCDGKRVWALARTGEAFKVAGDDEVRDYLMLATSYDGSFSTTASRTGVRVVCANTLRQSLDSLTSDAVRITHAATFDEAEVKKQLGLTADVWAAYTSTLEALTSIKLSEASAHKVLSEAFRVPAEIVNDTQRANKGHLNAVLEMFNTNSFVGPDLGNAAGTAWGLTNCVTEYVDFRKRARTQATRLNNSWFGEGAAIKQRAVAAALAEA